MTALVVAACLLLVVGPADIGNASLSALPVAALAFGLGACLPRRHSLLPLAALAASMQVNMGFADFPNFEIGFMTLLPWWAGTELQARRLLVRALAQRNREIVEEEDTFVRLSVRRERAAIAHELHDIVAHHVAVIVVQAGAGRFAADAPSQASERFAIIRHSGDQALAEMALLVDVLNADGDAASAGFERLGPLLDQARAGGLDVRLTPLAPDVAIAREIQIGAVRVIQEGLTNAIKHAPGGEVHVRLLARDDQLEVAVLDDGSAAVSALAATGSSLGLTAMRERVESLGGTLEAEPRPGGGWSLRACLPTR